MDLKKLIPRTESETIEFKKSTGEWKEIIETISAFSNTKGGKIVIGVSKSGKLLGVDIGKDSIEHLTNQISQSTDPKVHPGITIEKIKGKSIIIIEVKESSDHLVLAFGRPFKRVGKSTMKMSKDEYEKLILEKHKDKLRFDNQICKGATLKDIDEEKVRQFIEKTRFERRLDINLNTPVKEILEKLNLFKNSNLTNAAILLFGKHPQRFLMQAETKCARFKGIEPLEFIDMKVFGRSIIDQREDALEFVKEHIKLHATIKGTERIEKWEYPIEAIREAITNAICHRDYRIHSNVQIRIFEDRLEVWGCGPLPEPLTPDDLKKKHKSILRNPLIGKCFFLIKYIEEWGTGTNRMIKWCKEHNLSEPLFEELAGDFVVTFRKYHISDEILTTLTERQKKIIDYLKEYKKINRNEAMNLLNVSKNTAFRELLDLQKKGIVRQAGKGKNTYYFLR